MVEKQGMKEQELKALQLEIELGMTLIDTAEMHGNAGTESVVGEAIKGLEDKYFLFPRFMDEL